MEPTTKNVLTKIDTIKQFVPARQLEFIGDLMRGEEGEFFKAKLLELAELFDSMPKTYETDGQGAAAVAYLHYFARDCHWYITERDQEAEQHQAFGKANLGYGGELGYISLVELCGIAEVELDLHWTPKPLNKIGD